MIFVKNIEYQGLQHLKAHQVLKYLTHFLYSSENFNAREDKIKRFQQHFWLSTMVKIDFSSLNFYINLPYINDF